MSIMVVDIMKTIDIHKQDRKKMSSSLVQLKLFRDIGFHVPSARQTGEWIPGCHLIDISHHVVLVGIGPQRKKQCRQLRDSTLRIAQRHECITDQKILPILFVNEHLHGLRLPGIKSCQSRTAASFNLISIHERAAKWQVNAAFSHNLLETVSEKALRFLIPVQHCLIRLQDIAAEGNLVQKLLQSAAQRFCLILIHVLTLLEVLL